MGKRNRLLLIISGEFCRDGGQFSRERDSDDSLVKQLIATESHIDFINHLKNKYDIDTDVQILSYKSKHQDILIKKYNKYNLEYKFYNNYFSSRTELTNTHKLDSINDKYDSILVIRPDMQLKPFFLNVFNPYEQKICYPSVCFLGQHSTNQYPRVNDTMIFIPNKYFDLIYYTIGIKLYHDAIPDYIMHSKSINNSLLLEIDFDFMLKTLHDSDSAKDYNPIYLLISRPENKIWHSYGYQIRYNDFLPIEINQKYDFLDWNLKNNINIDLNPNPNIWEWWHRDIESEFSHLVNFIELDLTEKNKFNITNPKRHHNETYWKFNDKKELCFYDEYFNPTAILYEQNTIQFFGKSLNNDYYFTLKKAINMYSNI